MPPFFPKKERSIPMIYVTSDPHGYSLSRFQELLREAGFGPDDFLFVLGDVIDRGEYGAELLSWITQQSNVQLLLGNHEDMLLKLLYTGKMHSR